MSEAWLPVVGYERLYEVSSLGNVRSRDRVTLASNGQVRCYRGKPLRPGSDSSGYQMVALVSNGAQKMMRVHVLVLEAFVGPRPKDFDCCHGDGNKKNNRVENLRWDTRRNNLLDNIRSGVRKYFRSAA